MLYLLRQKGSVEYDEYDSKLIRAKSEKEAREIASRHLGDEGSIWDEPEFVECVRVYSSGESMEIIASFNAG